MVELRQELALNPPLPGSFTPRRGELCAAKFAADGQWYRARVEGAKGRDQVDIAYVDFGNRETVHANALAALPAAFAHQSAGAKEFRLAFVQLPKDVSRGGWVCLHAKSRVPVQPADAETATAFLAQLVGEAGPQLLLNVEYRAGGVEHATLHRPGAERQDLGRQLVAQGLATTDARPERRLQAVAADYRDVQSAAKRNRVRLFLSLAG